MELSPKKNNRRIFIEILKELVRHSAAYSQARKKSFVQPRVDIKISEKRIIAESPRLNAPQVRALKSTQNEGIENVVGKLKQEKYEVSLKPSPPKREMNRPALGPAKLTIPEQRLPSNFQYLQPTPTNKDMDLGKLSPLIRDQMVKIIDCPGPDQNIIVTGNMGTKKTGIILGRDEITEIVEKFSKESKIPVSEGVFRVVVGRFIFLAIISEIIGSRFTIRKMIAAPQR